MKSIIYFVVGILVLSGFSVLSMGDAGKKQEMLRLSFSEPIMVEKDGFVEIHIDGATTQWLEPDRPVLPIYVKTYQIPFRSTNIQVICTPKNIGTMSVSKEIVPARAVPLSQVSEPTTYVKDPSVYGSAAFYPSTWFSFDLGAGRNENDVQVTFVKVVCYPVRYSPMNNEISFAGSFDVTVTYNEPQAPLQSSAEEYDMVIIAPEKFSSKLQPLIDFKNSKGVITKFKSMESILSEYEGYDAPEQVKYFIKNEYDTANITYALLVGGLKNHIFAKDKDTRSAGWKAWWVPVRYVNMPYEDDEGCLSDLYYGCLYNGTGAFDSWDSNGDGIYAAWYAPSAPKDTIDMYPEVYVSRLPVASTLEVNHIVKKIINYESSGPAEKPWYKNFIGVAGKTSYMWLGQPDGEYLCDLAYNYTKLAIPDLNQIQVYSTNRDTGGLVPTPEDIAKTFREGAGFVDFEGHGYALGWNTIWFDGEYPKDWTGGIRMKHFWQLQNGEKLPVVVVGGCHNGLYNVSMIPSMINVNGTRYFCHGIPGPVCFSWGLIIKPTGGAIASTGCTGYGIGSSGDPATVWSAELESNFFYYIGHGATHLAQAHSQAIQKYITENSIGHTDAFCITNWALFGDPSLHFGGYSS